VQRPLAVLGLSGASHEPKTSKTVSTHHKVCSTAQGLYGTKEQGKGYLTMQVKLCPAFTCCSLRPRVGIILCSGPSQSLDSLVPKAPAFQNSFNTPHCVQSTRLVCLESPRQELSAYTRHIVSCIHLLQLAAQCWDHPVQWPLAVLGLTGASWALVARQQRVALAHHWVGDNTAAAAAAAVLVSRKLGSKRVQE
jgi:hypothetical protein